MSGSVSPLTIQSLLASGQTPQDPAIMSAMPRLQLAQAMMQQGVSDAPTSKWGALSRLGQALVGNYAFNEANSGIQDILKQRQQDTMNAVNSFTGGPSSPPPQASPQSLTPPAPAQQTSGFQQRLAGTESGNNPGAVNKQRYSGVLQFGVPRLADLKVYNPAPGEDLKANQFSGAFNIPGFPQVKTQADFLASPAAQSAVGNLHFANIDNVIANTPGADKFNQDGLRAVAHLGGNGGMQRFIETNGGYNPHDASGTRLSDYYQKFSGGPGTPPAAMPSPGVAPQAENPMAIIEKAQKIMAANPYNPDLQRAMQNQIETAKLRLTTGSYSQTAPGQFQDAFSGKPVFAPSPRVAQDIRGNTMAVGPGGQITQVASNPSGITGNSDTTNAARIIAEIGPKVASGNATPQEVASYNTALPMFQAPKPITTTPTETVTQVPTRPIPAGMPPAQQGNFGPAGAPPQARGPMSPPQLPGTVGGMTPATQIPPSASNGALGAVVTPNTDAIARQAQAAAQGSESGKSSALTSDHMFKLGSEASQGIGTIDSAIEQVHAAAQGGLPTGYFTPALAQAASAAKSMGIDTSKLGVAPEAVSNIQAANKSLALTAGSILRQILGPDSQITEGKLETFIHATPGLGTDPDAMTKILGWARSQFVYNHNMAMDAMRNADPQTGLIPPGWKSQYVSKLGSFGPIYNPLQGEMQQPTGKPPPDAPPASPAKYNPSDIAAEMRRRGLLK